MLRLILQSLLDISRTGLRDTTVCLGEDKVPAEVRELARLVEDQKHHVYELSLMSRQMLNGPARDLDFSALCIQAIQKRLAPDCYGHQ